MLFIDKTLFLSDTDDAGFCEKCPNDVTGGFNVDKNA